MAGRCQYWASLTTFNCSPGLSIRTPTHPLAACLTTTVRLGPHPFDNIMRPVKACLQCRSGKRRCDRTGDSACSQCLQRHLQCSAAIPNPPPGQPQAQAPQQLLPPMLSTRADEETIHLVDLYFRFIHDQPHSLFHEPSFKASVMAGTASQPVLLSMIGMSAR
jgi:Zn(2)-Cys(6) binuclear cluster domain-containing protein